MKKLALVIGLALLTGFFSGCGSGGSPGGDGGGNGQGGGQESDCLQRHPLLNTQRPTNREEAVAAFYQAKLDCNSSLNALVQKAKSMEKNGIRIE